MVKFFWNADKSNGYPCGVYVDDYPPWEKTSAPKSPCFATRHPTYASYMGSYCNVMSYCQMESFPAKGSYVTFPPLPSQFPAVPGTKLSPYNDGTGFPNSCQQTSGTNIKCAGVTGFLPSSVPSSC